MWNTTVSFEFVANDYDYYPDGTRQDLKFEVSGGQFYNYTNNTSCQNPPCATHLKKYQLELHHHLLLVVVLELVILNGLHLAIMY